MKQAGPVIESTTLLRSTRKRAAEACKGSIVQKRCRTAGDTTSARPIANREREDVNPVERPKRKIGLTQIRAELSKWKRDDLDKLSKALDLGARNNRNIQQMVDYIFTMPIAATKYSADELKNIRFRETGIKGRNSPVNEMIAKINKVSVVHIRAYRF